MSSSPQPNPPVSRPNGGAHRRLAEVVAAALERPQAERAAFIHAAAAGDEAFEAEAASLVDAGAMAGGFLDRPTVRGSASPVGTSVRSSVPGEGPGSTIGRYKLLEQIGEGGFGAVFMAEQREPVHRRVALKIIKLGMDTRAVIARFEAERQALALMDHPNIAKVLDAGATESGRPYFVMELVRGDPIAEHCDRHGLDTRARLELFTQVCRAVQHAHTKGIIHRDIKSSNVLVTMIDGRAVPKVIDFGIAKATSARLTEKTLFTEFRQMIGTPAYMSPEQADNSGVDVDARTDIYSLGVLLYELLTGVLPFDPQMLRSAAWGELQRIIREEEPPRPSTRLSTMKDGLASIAAQRRVEPARLSALIRGDLDWIVMRCLEKDRSRRYETAIGLGEDVDRFLRGDAVDAAPPSTLYRARKFVRRHRYGVTAAALVGCALVLGIAGTAAGLVQARHQRDRAIAAEAEQVRLREQADAARGGEERARKIAETAAAQSETVAGFLGDMLRGVGPAVAQGRDTTVLREILDKTVERLEKGELKNEPAAEADLRHVLGTVFNDMGQQDRAIALHRDALRLRIANSGPESKDATLSMNDLAVALWGAERYPEAEELLKKVLDIRRRTLKPDDPDIAIALNNLGMLLKERGDLDGAERMLREALEIRRRTLGPDSPEFLGAVANLATLRYEREDYAGAEVLARQALELSRRINGPRHPDLANNLNTLAWIQQSRGDNASAEPLLREALDIRRAVLPADHPSICDSLENLAICIHFHAEGTPPNPARAAEAVTLFEQAISIARKRAPEGDERTQRMLGELGQALLDAGRAADAETTLTECSAMRARLYPEGHPLRWTVSDADGTLSDALASQGKWEQAEARALSAAEWMLAHSSAKNPDSIRSTQAAVDRVVKLYESRAAAAPGGDSAEKAAHWRDRRPPDPKPPTPK